jgi:hypothetical protein
VVEPAVSAARLADWLKPAFSISRLPVWRLIGDDGAWAERTRGSIGGGNGSRLGKLGHNWFRGLRLVSLVRFSGNFRRALKPGVKNRSPEKRKDQGTRRNKRPPLPALRRFVEPERRSCRFVF